MHRKIQAGKNSFLTYYHNFPKKDQVGARIPSCLEHNYCSCNVYGPGFQQDPYYNFQILADGTIRAYDPRERPIVEFPAFKIVLEKIYEISEQ